MFVGLEGQKLSEVGARRSSSCRGEAPRSGLWARSPPGSAAATPERSGSLPRRSPGGEEGGGRAAGRRLGAAGPAHTGASDGKVSAGRTEQNSSEVRGAGLGRVTPPHPHA